MPDALLYAAPLEGMTTWLWRRVHQEVFGGAHRYFTPFLSPNANHSFQTRELDEVRHNQDMAVTPQLLTNSSEHFLWAVRELWDMGYEEVNFNLGCPSGTVCGKGKGAGLLLRREQLQQLLDEVFAALPRGMRVSVKTRIGWETDDEWPDLLALYNRYPISELIVHPRVRRDFYRGRARQGILGETETAIPVIYNGDLFTPQSVESCLRDYPWLRGVMVGRGLMANPALLRQCQGDPAASREELRRYHDALYEAYCRRCSGDLPAIYKMRELWNYLSGSFQDTAGFLKKVRKARNRSEYLGAVEELFACHQLNPQPLPPAGK